MGDLSRRLAEGLLLTRRSGCFQSCRHFRGEPIAGCWTVRCGVVGRRELGWGGTLAI